MVTRTPKPASAAPDSMSIGALSRATGIAIDTLRTWERRYGVPLPTRKPSGHRLYPSSAVEHLRRVELLLNRGHRPAEVLPLPTARLDALLALSQGRETPGSARTASGGAEDSSATPFIAELIDASRALDYERVMARLRSHWIRLGPVRFLDECAARFMSEIGNGWASGEIDIRYEHFASAALTDFLREVRAPYAEQARGPVVVAAALEGDLHEGGLLMACVLLSVRGWQVVYLGANTPSPELIELAKMRDLDAIALSVSAAMSRPRVVRTVRALRAKLPRRLTLWVGGAGAPVNLRGVDRFGSLAELDVRLAIRGQ